MENNNFQYNALNDTPTVKINPLPQNQSSKNKKKIVLLIVISILLLALVASSYIFLAVKNKPEVKKEENLNNQQVSTSDAVNQPSENIKSASIKIDPVLMNKSIEDCKKQQEYEKAICSFDLALLFKDEKLCDINSRAKNDMMGRNFCIAVVGRDKNICQSFADSKLQEICLAIVENNCSKCTYDYELENEVILYYNNLLNSNKIFDDFIGYCNNFAKFKENAKLTPFWFKNKDQCYDYSTGKILEFGLESSYDESICSILPDKSLSKYSCYSTIAIKRKNSSICEKIEDIQIKNMCIATSK